MAERRVLWETKDGKLHNSAQEADEHELNGDIANLLMARLGFTSLVADRIAANFRDIACIVKEVKQNAKTEKDS